jgi:lysozyme
MKSLSKILVAVFALFFAVSSAYAQTRGIDVSRHQKTIDWKKVSADNVQFVYVKVSEGATYRDPMYKKNIEGAQKEGILVGAYHYFRMTSTPEEQFENFKSALKDYELDLVPMIDVETSDNKSVKDLQKNLDKFIALVKAEYGVPPMIYGTQRSYNTYCAPKYNKYHLYIGRYGSHSPEIKGKGTYTIWQYTENGKVNGITEDVDICKFNPKYGIKDIKVKKK